MSDSFSITIVNNRGNEKLLNLLLTGDSITGAKGFKVGKSTSLADFRKDNSNMTLSMDTISGGRLYVGYGPLAEPPLQPIPDSKQYFGWIEFSKTDANSTVWINLTNVDLVGLPVTLQGTLESGEKWSLGLKNSVTDIIDKLKAEALNEPLGSAVIKCTTGQTKVVAPNIIPQDYRSFDAYLASLGGAKLSITSDTTTAGVSKTFTGKFLAPATEEDPIIELRSAEGDTFVVFEDQFTTNIIYECDGGTIQYNDQTLPQNRTAENDPGSTEAQRTITNSTFRNICIGMNEGYFSPDGDNNSVNFPAMVPFEGNRGNLYAKVVNKTTNSYGFPYADSNLKVLIQAAPNDALTLTLLTDTQAANYDANPPAGGNSPTSGEYEFGIGANSSDLGMVSVMNADYPADPNGAYGGFLPTFTQWTQINFAGPDKYIWYRAVGTGEVVGADCFLSNGNPTTITWNADPTTGQYILTWPGDVSWNPAKQSPAKPQN